MSASSTRRLAARLLALLLALAVALSGGVAVAQVAPTARPPEHEPAPAAPPHAHEHATGAAAARDLLGGAPGELELHVPPVPRDYVTVRRGPLEVSYPPALEPQVRATLANAERDARAVAAQLGLAEVPRLDVRLVPDPDVMRALAPVEVPPPAYAVGVAYPAIGLTLVSASAPATWEAADMRRVLRHELSHLLLAVATRYAAIPRWFSEGVAIHQAGEHSFERFRTLAVASFTGGLVPLRRLDASFSSGPDQVNAAYAESADFVAYVLRSEGEARFAVLVGHLREGMPFEESVRQTYGSSLTQLELEWRQDVSSRFMTAPLWAGTGFFWLLGSLFLVVAFVRRKRRSRETLARWAREESAADGPPRLFVVTPGLRSSDDATTHTTDVAAGPSIPAGAVGASGEPPARDGDARDDAAPRVDPRTLN